MPENKEIQKILKGISNAPGVYKMLDKEGRVIYIGKAKNLGKRVKQYFQKNYEHSSRTKKLLEKVNDIQTIGVDSELEATILEHNLIKQLQPKYNVIMKDDKNFVYIKITKEDFPRVQIVRQIEKDNAKYIGPKTAAHKVKETLKILKKIFPFRHCGLDIDFIKENPPTPDGKTKHEVKVTRKVIKYPCLDYFIKRCVAPCIGGCNKEEYQEIIKNVEDFLTGKADGIINKMYDQMNSAAAEKKFEKAASIRDKIKKVEQILEKQNVASTNQEDKDIINYCITQDKAYFNLFQIRDDKLIGQENFILNAKDAEESESGEVLEAFLNQYYELATDIPKEILIPYEIDNLKHIAEFINNQTKRKVKLIAPKIGDKNKLLEMSLNNARIFADRNKAKWQEENPRNEEALKALQDLLKITTAIKRLECYDISHLSGTDTVGSMVVFEKGIPKKDMYRKFKLRTVQGKPDDYRSMEEVLYRRFSKIALKTKFKEYKFTKSKIKNEDERKKTYLVQKDKIQVGTISLTEHNDKIGELTGLFIEKKERGHKLGHYIIKNALEKSKAKRIYIICRKELQEYYMLAGFEEIKTIPAELEESKKAHQKTNKEITLMAYDKAKHKEDKSFNSIPDLVIIDGGKGQLSAAGKIFKELNIELPYISLAKRLEEIFQPDSPIPILLEKNNEALKLLQRARDEAHRFAITYNKELRSKKFRRK